MPVCVLLLLLLLLSEASERCAPAAVAAAAPAAAAGPAADTAAAVGPRVTRHLMGPGQPVRMLWVTVERQSIEPAIAKHTIRALADMTAGVRRMVIQPLTPLPDST